MNEYRAATIPQNQKLNFIEHFNASHANTLSQTQALCNSLPNKNLENNCEKQIGPVKFSDGKRVNTNNNDNKCLNNDKYSTRPVIKSEHVIKTEKSSAAMNSKSNAFNVSNEYLSENKGYFDRNSSNNVNQTNSNLLNVVSTNSGQVPISSACVTSAGSTAIYQQSHDYSTLDSSQSNHQSQQRGLFDTRTNFSAHNMDDAYLREQQFRNYTQMTELNSIARPAVSYPNEIVSSRTAGYDISSSRSYEATPFDRYDMNCLMSQRSNMYPYLHPTMEDLSNQQKYLHEQHQMAQAMLKSDHDETAGPLYPRPMYHYDPSTGPLPPGFSAINLSVKVAAAAQAAQAFKASTAAAASAVASGVNITATNVSSSSPHDYNSTRFVNRTANSSSPSSTRLGDSPAAVSPRSHEQSVDLSSNSLPNR